jgi:hypothetical protein
MVTWLPVVPSPTWNFPVHRKTLGVQRERTDSREVKCSMWKKVKGSYRSGAQRVATQNINRCSTYLNLIKKFIVFYLHVHKSSPIYIFFKDTWWLPVWAVRMSLDTVLKSRFPAAPSSDLHGTRVSFQGQFATSWLSAVNLQHGEIPVYSRTYHIYDIRIKFHAQQLIFRGYS